MRHIHQAPAEILYTVSQPVNQVDSYIKELAKDMTLILSGALGIAAVQFGEPVRLIGVRRDSMTNLIIINPEITRFSAQTVKNREACLSISLGRSPFTVLRHKRVKVTGYNLEGGKITIKAQGQLSYILQHEIDHLNGILIG